MTSRIRALGAIVLGAAVAASTLGLGACTWSDRPTDGTHSASSEADSLTPRTTSPDTALTLVADTTQQSASISTAGLLFEHSSVVVVAPAGHAAAQTLAATTAVALGVPLLVGEPPAQPGGAAEQKVDDANDALAHELDRLGATTVVVAGEPEGMADLAAAANLTTVNTASGDIPAVTPAQPRGDVIALAIDDPEQTAPVATARAAGVEVQLMASSTLNPLATPAVVEALSASTATKTIALGAGFAGEAALDWKIRAARAEAQLPGGGALLFPQHQFIALYGTPGTPSMGVLGEQDAAAAIQRAKDVAAPYAALTDKTVVPMLEIITTVAAGSAGADGNYSNELDAATLRPWIDEAAAAGVYVVLDLQPGRTDFLTQAKHYQSLLELPNVGLAIDPEWRLYGDQVHLQQIGSVGAAEVNEVTAWLATLTNDKSLPQKMLVLHQFRPSMLQDRASIDMTHPELAMLIHADGLGTQPDKQATWRTLHQDAPTGVAWGWKNFYDEDAPMLSPEETMHQVSPAPDLVTYQ